MSLSDIDKFQTLAEQLASLSSPEDVGKMMISICPEQLLVTFAQLRVRSYLKILVAAPVDQIEMILNAMFCEAFADGAFFERIGNLDLSLSEAEKMMSGTTRSTHTGTEQSQKEDDGEY